MILVLFVLTTLIVVCVSAIVFALFSEKHVLSTAIAVITGVLLYFAIPWNMKENVKCKQDEMTKSLQIGVVEIHSTKPMHISKCYATHPLFKWKLIKVRVRGIE